MCGETDDRWKKKSEKLKRTNYTSGKKEVLEFIDILLNETNQVEAIDYTAKIDIDNKQGIFNETWHFYAQFE